MNHSQPPKWIDQFLTWYCAPEFLDEIQGDAHELYADRLEHQGKLKADLRYIYDIIRFCQLSNIKRSSIHRKPNNWDILIYSSLKIASRNAGRNKLIFSIKMLSLSLCMAFSLLLAAFVIQEYSYDRHIDNYQDIYRIGTKAYTRDNLDSFAMAPGLLEDALTEIPEVENVCRISFLSSMHVYGVGEDSFSKEKGMIVQEEFADIFNIEFLHGTSESLSEPDNVVLTASTAQNFFGDENPIGEIISLNNGFTLDVAGVIVDPSPSSHLQYDLLMSRSSFDVQPTWDELAGYTYYKFKHGVDVQAVQEKVTQLFRDHKKQMTKYLASTEDAFTPIFENIVDIHLGPVLKDDIAIKRSMTNIHFIILLSVVFFLSGFINFLNLSIADVTSNLKQIGVLHIMGGSSTGIVQSILASTTLGIVILLPLTTLFFLFGINASETFLSLTIEHSILTSAPFMLLLVVFICVFLLSSKLCQLLISKSFNLLVALKGKMGVRYANVGIREYLLALQLSFSVVIIGLILIMIDQFDFINEADNGFDDKQTLVIKMPVTHYLSGTSTFEESLRNLNGVQQVSVSSLDMESEPKYYCEIETKEGRKSGYFYYHDWGYDFIDLLKIQLIEGRNFDRSRGTDRTGKVYLINESAKKSYGWEQPIGKRIYVDDQVGHVIGVVKDFRTTSMHKEIGPMTITLSNDNSWNEYTYVKLDSIHTFGLLSDIEEVYYDHFQGAAMSWEYLDNKLTNLYRQDFQLRDIFKIGLFISLIVSCLGIFSISALMLILKAKEMSIRKVVGAQSFDLFYLHIRNFIKFTLLAAICSSPLLYYLANYWLNNFTYRIDLNAWYFIVPILLTLFIILLTSGIHGLRSSK